ncbi:MAG: sulfurtransferase TusA family protein [Gammaproteobacteria bacterium]|nr:sulfurtransferase TusA family protein [Gammaproteobacteria bacterium]MCP5409508.1 sulfurtransferase TusA family protein [Chromatiaceae bacterium]MCP5444780.1 sulfurtransferase TusA family protein [Chromatiaceae bacterium]
MNPVIVDARRLLCPMPVIRVQNSVAELCPGTLVEVLCTDPGALNDIPSWCRINGHRVVETRCLNDEYLVILEVGEE